MQFDGRGSVLRWSAGIGQGPRGGRRTRRGSADAALICAARRRWIDDRARSDRADRLRGRVTGGKQPWVPSGEDRRELICQKSATSFPKVFVTDRSDGTFR